MDRYGWRVVGTFHLTEKKVKDREEFDFPFPSMSKGALARIAHGWSRRATLRVNGRRSYVVKLLFGRTRSLLDGSTLMRFVRGKVEGHTTKRYVQGRGAERVTIDSPMVQEDYAHNFNAVDISSYSTSLRSNRWYLRCFFSSYVVAIYYAESGLKDEWKKYMNKNRGRYRFQIDLGLALIDAGIRMDWADPFEEDATKPKWMRTAHMGYHPCCCKKCFFCKNGKTTGVASPPRKRKRATQPAQGTRQTAVRCSAGRMKIFQTPRKCTFCLATRRGAVTQGQSHEIWDESKCKSHGTTHGCPRCMQAVCQYCWPTYKHKSKT